MQGTDLDRVQNQILNFRGIYDLSENTQIQLREISERFLMRELGIEEDVSKSDKMINACILMIAEVTDVIQEARIVIQNIWEEDYRYLSEREK